MQTRLQNVAKLLQLVEVSEQFLLDLFADSPENIANLTSLSKVTDNIGRLAAIRKTLLQLHAGISTPPAGADATFSAPSSGSTDRPISAQANGLSADDRRKATLTPGAPAGAPAQADASSQIPNPKSKIDPDSIQSPQPGNHNPNPYTVTDEASLVALLKSAEDDVTTILSELSSMVPKSQPGKNDNDDDDNDPSNPSPPSDSSDPSDPSDSATHNSSAPSASSTSAFSAVKNSSSIPKIQNLKSEISPPCLRVSVVKNSSSNSALRTPHSALLPTSAPSAVKDFNSISEIPNPQSEIPSPCLRVTVVKNSFLSSHFAPRPRALRSVFLRVPSLRALSLRRVPLDRLVPFIIKTAKRVEKLADPPRERAFWYDYFADPKTARSIMGSFWRKWRTAPEKVIEQLGSEVRLLGKCFENLESDMRSAFPQTPDSS